MDTAQCWPSLSLPQRPAPPLLLWEPFPAQVFYLPLAFSQVPGNKWAGQGKVLAAGDENKTNQNNTRFQRKDAKNGSPGRGWQSQLARKDQGAQLCWRRPGSLVGAGEPSRAVSGPPGLSFRRWLPVLAARPAGPPHGPGQRGGQSERRARPAAGRPGQSRAASLHTDSLLRQEEEAEAGASAARKFVFLAF